MRAAARAAPTAPCKITVPGFVGAGLAPARLSGTVTRAGGRKGRPYGTMQNHRSRFRRGGACPRPLESQLELERPGKRVFSDPSCELSPDRISKDVEGRLIERLVVPQDSLKETPLPKPTGSSSFQTRDGTQRLPRSDECGQRCLSPDSHQKMNVIGHQTVRVTTCRSLGTAPVQKAHAFPAEINVGKDGGSRSRPDGHGKGATGFRVHGSPEPEAYAPW